MNQTPHEPIAILLTEREAATVVAALRNWQMDFEEQDLEEAFEGHFRLHWPLDRADIHDLCKRLKFDESQGYCII